MIIEIAFGFFGIMGMGWLYAENIAVGIAVFVGFAVLLFIEVAIATATIGIALCVIIPLNIALAVISGLRVRDHMRNTGKSGSILHVIVGIVVGVLVMCGGITLITLAFGGLATLSSGM